VFDCFQVFDLVKSSYSSVQDQYKLVYYANIYLHWARYLHFKVAKTLDVTAPMILEILFLLRPFLATDEVREQ
jgi:hypothetical protein